jgi:hypothetical protein
MFFIVLTAFTALFVAGCSAFFSIKGLTVLFAGSAVAVGIMASSLELGKLIAASFLHNHWKNISRLLRLYLCTAVVILMGITSLGIFGFLSNAYQEHAAVIHSLDAKIEMTQAGRQSALEAIELASARIKSLTEIRSTQEQRLKESGNLKAPREQAYKAISEANEELARKEQDVQKARENLTVLDKEITELKISSTNSTDIGSFRFIANALHTDLDTAVQYFIFALIAVFDPLAVTLVLALNRLMELRADKKRASDIDYVKDILARVNTPAEKPLSMVEAQYVVNEEKYVVEEEKLEEPVIAEEEKKEQGAEQETADQPAQKAERRRRAAGANKSIIMT